MLKGRNKTGCVEDTRTSSLVSELGIVSGRESVASGDKERTKMSGDV